MLRPYWLFAALTPALLMGIPSCGNSHSGDLGDSGVAWFSNDLVGTDEEWPVIARGSSFDVWIEIDECRDTDDMALTSSDPYVVDVTATSSIGDGGWSCESSAWGEAVALNDGTSAIELRHRYSDGDDDDDMTDDDDTADDDSAGDDDDSAGDDDDSAGDDDDTTGDDDDTNDEEITDPDDMELGGVIDSIGLQVAEPTEIALLYGDYEIQEPVALTAGSEVTLAMRVRDSSGRDLGFDAIEVDWAGNTPQISQLANGANVSIEALLERASDRLRLKFGGIERMLDVSTVSDIDRLEVIPVRQQERQFVVYVAAATQEGVLILDPAYSYEVISGNPSIQSSPTQITVQTRDWTTPVRIRFTAGTAVAHLSLRAEAQSNGSWPEAVQAAQRQQPRSTAACAVSPYNGYDSATILALIGLFVGLVVRRRS